MAVEMLTTYAFAFLQIEAWQNGIWHENAHETDFIKKKSCMDSEKKGKKLYLLAFINT